MAARPEFLLEHAWLRCCLFPFALLYRFIINTRNRHFDKTTAHRVPVPIISVGNITTGGTGKTPVVEYIARYLHTHNKQPAIISRGYRGTDGSNDEAKASAFPVFCHPERRIAAEQAITQDASVLILDDGFQHRRLHRDLNIVLIDCLQPWGLRSTLTPHILPSGLLREPLSSLSRADIILLTRCNQVSAERTNAICHQITTTCTAPILKTQHQALHLRALHSDTTTELSSLAEQTVILCSGIGNPDGFEKTCETLAYHVHKHFRFPDHHHYTQTDIETICALCTDHNATLVTTSKDAVKLSVLQPTCTCFVLEIGIHCDTPETLHTMIDQTLTATQCTPT